MTKKIMSIAAAALMFAACNEPLNEAAEVEDNSQELSQSDTDGETILGKEIENPYSLTYMRQALKELSKSKLSKTALDYEIKANFLHVRFLPANDEEFETLLSDTSIELFDRPMLCEIKQEGEKYHDPSLPEDAITWQYTTVPVNYNFPKVKYEILDSCFVPEDMDENISKSFYNFDPTELTPIAFKLAGMEDELEKNISKKRKAPKGQFKVWDNLHNNAVGISGINVCVYNGIRWDHTHTDVDGYYTMSKHYATNQVHYKIKFRTSDDIIINNLMFDLDAADEGLGWHSHGGYSKTFYENSKVWMWATVNNAVYIYKRDICPHFNIPSPNIKLHIFASNGKSKNWAGCTPMARHMNIKLANWETFCVDFLGLQPVKAVANKLAPDMMIFHKEKTENIYSTVFHEMSHVCHYIQAGKNYWQEYAKFIITNNGYGEPKDSKSGFVGVGEMWGYYFGNYASDNYYIKNTDRWNANKSWFMPGILYGLVEQQGIQPYQILSCMTGGVYSHEKLKQALCNKFPTKRSGIIKEFKDYGF